MGSNGCLHETRLGGSMKKIIGVAAIAAIAACSPAETEA